MGQKRYEGRERSASSIGDYRRGGERKSNTMSWGDSESRQLSHLRAYLLGRWNGRLITKRRRRKGSVKQKESELVFETWYKRPCPFVAKKKGIATCDYLNPSHRKKRVVEKRATLGAGAHYHCCAKKPGSRCKHLNKYHYRKEGGGRKEGETHPSAGRESRKAFRRSRYGKSDGKEADKNSLRVPGEPLKRRLRRGKGERSNPF